MNLPKPGAHGDPPSATRPRVRVLVVDDDPSICITTAALLEDHYEVRTAGSFREALRAVDVEVPDVIATDYEMPDGTGVELMRQVTERHPSVGGVLVTGYKDYLERDKAAVDAFYVVLKPYEPSRLIDAIECALRFAKMQRAAARAAVVTAPRTPAATKPEPNVATRRR